MTPKKRLTKLREMLLPTTASILPRSSNIFDWPLASLRRHCDRMPHPPTRVIATAREAGGKQSRKNNATRSSRPKHGWPRGFKPLAMTQG